MAYRLPDGRTIEAGVPFKCNGVSRPANFIELASEIELAEAGITRVDVPIAAGAEDVGIVKSKLLREIEMQAEQARLSFLTPGYGKSLSYQEKLSEARLVLDDPQSADASIAPILAREAEIRGISLEAAALLVHQTYLAFKSVEARINAAEVSGKLSVQSADSVEAARAAYQAINWQVS